MDYGTEAINRHRASRGKVSIASKMKVETMEELSIAYTPGVAAVSMAIYHDKSESFALTNRGNTVAVVSDGSAVLGLGNVGPEAALAVMEGKSILFKGLADKASFMIPHYRQYCHLRRSRASVTRATNCPTSRHSRHTVFSVLFVIPAVLSVIPAVFSGNPV